VFVTIVSLLRKAPVLTKKVIDPSSSTIFSLALKIVVSSLKFEVLVAVF
jgi:hypothetical protein